MDYINYGTCEKQKVGQVIVLKPITFLLPQKIEEKLGDAIIELTFNTYRKRYESNDGMFYIDADDFIAENYREAGLQDECPILMKQFVEYVD